MGKLVGLWLAVWSLWFVIFTTMSMSVSDRLQPGRDFP